MRSAASILAYALVALAACGGQTGEGDEGGNNCVDREMSAVGDDEQGPLGYSPTDVLAFANSQPLRIERAGADQSQLMGTLSLELRPGTAQFIRTELLRPVSEPDPCRGRLEQGVEVALDIELPSGNVQLRAAGTLHSDSRYRALLSATFSAADFERVQNIELESDAEPRSLELRATLTPAGSAGTLQVNVDRWVRVGPQPEPRGGAPRVHDFVEQRQEFVARWPAASACSSGELPLPVDRALFEITPAEVLSAFAQPRELDWSDGTSTRLTFDARATGDACLADLTPSWHESIDWPSIAPEDPVLFGLPIELTVATEDGRFRDQFSVMLQYQPKKAGGLSRAWLVRFATLVPGDTGGWALDVADISEARSTVLRILHQPDAPAADGGGDLMLAGPPRGEPCGSKKLCTNLPAVASPLLRGKLH